MTSDHDSPIDACCFTDYALQEHVVGRLSTSLSADVMAHLSVCDPCRSMEADIRLEEQYFAQLPEQDLEAECIEEITLGMFLDDALLQADRGQVEAHIVGCTPCRKRLIALRQGVSSAHISSQEMVESTDEDPVRRPDLVLMMAKRESVSRDEELPHFPMRETGTDI